MRRVLSGRDLGPFLGSVRPHRTLASAERDLPRNASGPVSGRKSVVEKVWREFFSDPSQWWDHRSEKLNARYPDFVHKKTQGALWLNGKSNPPWVEAEVAAMAPGTVQLNVFSWNTRLARYAKAGQYEKTMELFQQMRQEGMEPDRFTFVPVLNACAGLRALGEGRRIHTQIIQSGFELDVYVGSSLIGMYSKCGNIEDAWTVFNKMPLRSVVSWNIMILGHVKCGQGQKALELFRQMQREGLEPLSITFVAGLNACASVGALAEGKQIHKDVIEKGFELDSFVASSLIDMYAKCWSIDHAERVFNNMAQPDVVSCSAMIQGYVKCGHGGKALELSRRMQREGLEPVPPAFVGLLNACARLGTLEVGRHVHDWIIKSGCESDIFVGSSLVDMYAKCGSIEDAWRVFNKMPMRDVVSWSAMIQGFVNNGQGERALELFRKMEQDGVEPGPVTFVGVLNACASVGALEEGQRIHMEVIQRGFEANIFVGSSLVDMYAKCGSIDNARAVFDKMAARDVVSWNAMILGYVKCGQGQESLNLFRQMYAEGVVDPDPVTFVGVLNACASVGSLDDGRHVHEQILERGCESDVFVSSSLVDMYAKCGSMEDAWGVFNKMPSRNIVSFNAMVLGYVKCGQGRKALKLAQRMEMDGIKLDPITFVGVLNACASIAALYEGRHFHEQITRRGYESDVFVSNSLIDMYAKCGSIEDSCRVFNEMPMRNMVSWNAMLGGYAIHGHAKEALEHFERMCHEGVQMDAVTFVSLLSACSHEGLVDQGLYYFQRMHPLYRISETVEHYTCLVDLLGRSGRLHEAEELIMTMSGEPNAAVWMSLLGACRVHGNVEMEEHIARKLLELDLRSAQASGQRLERGLKKQLGHTWIEVNGDVHSFTLDDQDHPQIDEIHAELKRLSVLMEGETGFMPGSRSALHAAEENGKASLLHHHNDKLAIAYGLISTPQDSPIRIFKNLRVCGDCHAATKVIAKMVRRQIIVKDPTRFHHFQGGLCSCRDYW